MKPWRIALGYIAFSVLALALFAVPLWYGWRTNIGTFRTYVPEEMQQLVDLFQREGPAAVTAALRANPRLPRDEVVLFAGPGKQVLAGTLRAWPAEVPPAPGTYGLVIDLGADAPVRIVASHVTLPGDYHLLMGRESVRFESLVERFWYGMVSALAVVLALGGALAWMLARRTNVVRHSAEALRRSEERYSLAIEASEEGYVDANVDTEEFITSERLNEIFGIAPGTRFKDRDDFLKQIRFHGDDGEIYHQTMRAVATVGGPDRYQFEFRIVRPSGEVRWLRTRGKVTRDAEGRARRRVGVVADITARKLAEEALRESQGRYARAMEATEAGHWEWDLVTHQVFHSPRFRELYGIGPEETFANREAWKARQPLSTAERERQERALQAAISDPTKPYDIEVSFELRPGEVRWLRSRGKVFRAEDGRPLRVTGATTDITAQKLAQEALRGSEERYALAMDAAGDGHTDWNLVTGEFYISPRMLKIVGHPRDATFADRADWVRRFPFHPEDRPRWEAAVAEHFAGAEAKFSMDLRIVVNGETRWVAFTFIASRDPAGKPVRWTGSIADINDAKLAEDALRRSEERYARVMEASKDGMWDWDLVKDEYYVSPKLIELSGLPPGAKFASREDFMRQHSPLHPDDRDKWQQAVRQLFASGDSRLTMVLRSIVKGETQWHRLSGICQRDATGRVVRWTGSTLDVTETKHAEEALRESEERFRSLIDVAPVAIVLTALHPARVLQVNQEFTRMFGFSAEETVGRSLRELIAPSELLDDYAANADSMSEGKKVEREVVRRRKDGSRFHVHLTGVPLQLSNGVACTFLMYRDLTERELAADALRKSEERFALAVAGSDDGVWDLDFVAQRVFLSARARELTGLPPGPDMMPLDEFTATLPIHPDDVPRRMAAMQAHLTGQAPAYEGEFRLRQLDGVYRWRRIHGICVRNANGRPQRMAGSFSDVDARRRAEEALRLSEERYALALEASDEGHFDLDLGTGEVFASARLNEIYGFPRQATTADRLEYVNRIPFHPDDRHLVADIARADWEDPARLQRLERYVVRIIPRPGETRWIQTHAMVTRDAQGRPRRRVGVVTDITERKLAEEARRLSEERYALAVAGSNDGIWDWDLLSGRMFVSERAQLIFGLEPGPTERLREEWHAMIGFHPDDHQAQRRMVEDYLSGARPGNEGEWRVRGKDGGYRWIRIRSTCLRNAAGGAVRMAGSVSDIDAQKKAETALRLSEERYALAVAGASDGIWDEDYTTNLLYRSPRNQEIALGRPSDGIDVRPRAEWAQWHHVHPDDAPKRDAALRAHLEDRAPIYEIEYRVRHPDGIYHWILARGVCIRDASGRPLRIAGSTTNIDARKAAEEALHLSEERHALALEVAEEGHFDWDVQSDEIFASPHLKKLLDVPADTEYRTRGEINAQVRYPPGERRRLEEMTVRVLGGPDLQHEFEYRVLRGEEMRWLRRRWRIFRDATGAAVRVTGVLSDITERKLAAEALRLSEERYAYAMEAAQDAHWDWKVGTDEYYTSPRVVDVFGLPPGTSFTSRKDYLAKTNILEEDLQAWQRAAEELFAGSGSRLSMELRAIIHGEVRWIQHNGVCLRDASGRAVRWCGTVRDTTERRRAEEALRLSEERYALAVAGSNEGIFDWDLTSDRVYVSSRAQELFGLPRGELWRPRRDWRHILTFHPEDAPKLHDSIKAHIEGGTPTYDVEFRIVLPDGGVRWFRQRGIALRDASGKAYRVVGSIGDVTERKQAGDTLRESEARFRRMTELSADTYWEQDKNFRYTRTGEAADIAGYVPDANQGKTRWGLSGAPTALSSSWEEHQAVLAAHQPFRDFEYRRLRPDGTIGYYSASGAPMFDPEGRFIGYQGVARDLTQRKRIEEELRSRQEMLELAQQAARSVPWEFRNDAGAEANRWAPELEALFGLPPGGFDGTAEGWWKLCHPGDRARVKSTIARTLATGEIDVEYRVIHPGGKVRWLNQKGRAFVDAGGKPVRSIGVMFDVTERRKVEDELRSRQEMLDLAQKSARAVAYEWKIGAGEGENRWSADLEAMYGLAPGTYDGTFEAWKKLVHPDDRSAVMKAILHAQRTGEISVEYRVLHQDGSVHWLQSKGRMLFDAAGKPGRIVGFMQDITDRKQAEEELRKMERELRRAQRLEGMGTLAGGIAHDFNNILGAILGYGEMALRDAKQGTRLRRDLDSIMAAGERGRSLIDRILAFSRSGIGERVPVHVEEVVREALDQVAAKLPESVTIAPRLRAGRAAMLGDSTQVHQVVMNLASNAVQAMPKGGVLRVALETARLDTARMATIGGIVPGDYLVLRVSDTGTGIAQDVLERMFDPFFTTKEVGVGSGLGLSLVHGIVTSVGGAVDVATQLGKGTTFTVYLRRSGDAPEKKAADEDRALPRGEGQRVLVVDDEEPLVKLATRTLEELGYAPTGFTSSTAALAAFRADPARFDALLTDERMPGLTGSALIREVRGIRAAIPVVLMSGYLGMESVDADIVVRKPVSARDLAASMARALRA